MFMSMALLLSQWVAAGTLGTAVTPKVTYTGSNVTGNNECSGWALVSGKDMIYTSYLKKRIIGAHRLRWRPGASKLSI